MSAKTERLGLTKPSITDKVADTIDALATDMDLLDRQWPVGSIYMSTRGTDPGTFLGGTWSRIQGRFLVGAGSSFAAGTTGGSTSMGMHRNGDEAAPADAKAAGLIKKGSVGFGGRVLVSEDGYTGKILPPYLAVYIWERTA